MNKHPDIVPEEAPLIILDINSSVCMAHNGRYTKQKGHIFRRVNSVRNGENYNMHKIDWCEGGFQFSDMATKTFGENYLNPRIKYIMVRLENWDRTLVK